MDEALVAKLELMTKQFVVLKPIEVRLDNLLTFDLVFTLNILLFTLFLSICLSLPPSPPSHYPIQVLVRFYFFEFYFKNSSSFASSSSSSHWPWLVGTACDVVMFVSTSVALCALVAFFQAYQPELAPHKPMGKLLAIKVNWSVDWLVNCLIWSGRSGRSIGRLVSMVRRLIAVLLRGARCVYVANPKLTYIFDKCKPFANLSFLLNLSP
jgi:hypothetical protein